jgi:polyisoprenyl-phosphate glycosyltransferase
MVLKLGTQMTTSRSKKKLSVILACYKDAQAIPILYKRLTAVMKKVGMEYELIFVNDGSPDNTEIILDRLAKKDVRVVAITHARNFSSQMAFTSGMALASGDAVILMDGDGQDPPEVIPLFIEQWQAGFDVVYGVRVKREATWIMNKMYVLFYRLFRKLSYIPIPVDAGDFSLMDKKVVAALKLFPERDRFIRGLRAWVGFTQTGVNYVRPERLFGISTNNWWKNIRWATKAIFSFSYLPLEYMTMAAFTVFVIAFLGMIIQIILRIIFPDTPHGVTTILVVVLFMGSIQLLGISILGEYLAKVFEEVKQRPPYIVTKIIRKKKVLKTKKA